MKIALVHRKYTRAGGVEKNVVMLAEGLAARGHEVHLFCNKLERELPGGVRFQRVPVIRLGTAAKYRSFARNAEAAVGKEDFDLVQGFDLTTRQDVLRVGRGLMKVYREVLGSTRGWFDRVWRSVSPEIRSMAELERRMLLPENTRVIVTNSRTVREELMSAYGVVPERIEVIPNGIDLARFDPARAIASRDASRARFGLRPEDRVVLHVGTGFRRKGVDLLLEAFARVARGEPRARLLVVGRDGRARTYRRLARSLGIGEKVVFAGPIPVDAALYGAADVVALASRYEPFGNVILEALACGIPAVHPASGGAAEALERGGLARLVLGEAEDVGSLAEVLSRVLSEAGGGDGAGDLARASRQAAERYSESACLDRYERLYERLVGAGALRSDVR